MVSNEKLIEAAKNPENIAIMTKAALNFSFLDRDDIESCKLVGLWKALEAVAQNKTDVKFTTSLYNHVRWQCLDIIKNNISTVDIPSNLEYPNDNDYSDKIEEILAIPDGDILIDKYIFNLTLAEIADKKNLTQEGVRYKIMSVLSQLK